MGKSFSSISFCNWLRSSLSKRRSTQLNTPVFPLFSHRCSIHPCSLLCLRQYPISSPFGLLCKYISNPIYSPILLLIKKTSTIANAGNTWNCNQTNQLYINLYVVTLRVFSYILHTCLDFLTPVFLQIVSRLQPLELPSNGLRFW
uniref:Uncharacterized protein n=1 Tax=uncultured marine virus TaxID=186617 RepID=A0A0F7L8J7_9VIRU|nr:hypothetical protein [uncultured marine virus]